jgi:RHS repeat-associated protein
MRPGYNAHSGKLPPDAVPPGVALPGKPAMQGARTSAQGYGMNDGVRQQFTSKERDSETGLDYFGARYYSSTQGRFTNVDPVIDFKSNLLQPQGWNQYQYALNNPLRYVDPDGQSPQEGADLNQRRDIKDLMEHRIDEKTYSERQNARAAGAAIGATLVAVALAGKEIGATILFWMAANPDKVQQIASVLQETGGAPPSMISGVGTASKAEWSIARKLAAEGRDVEIVAAQGAGRTADFVVNGVKTELKTLEGVGGVATSGTVKNAIGRGLGQSGNVIVDARGVKLTAEAAQNGAARAFGADKRLQVVRIIGKDYDFTIARH